MELSGRCDLHRTAALTISDNVGFTFGGCDPINITLPVATPAPSTSIAVTSTRVAMEISYPPRAKRGVRHHRHGPQHGNGHHH
ncbi:hypothetical protein N7489_003981 [Penicillium chrysogenum]|uniref:uncharacterized protein n=1 Tax=Penicillium chrysogenum TaxID=5076 RepID=UPI0024DF1665|nr:uncharacterized protein N7489_003981 [Penicillium chrysogenum]KAJ5243885.1 hypothetical protein N7489_003981 [Penicillium chrysogenum]KAJ6163704.1 hypothetical protein N7497_003683 [Penicillium chrysogenum]